MKIFDFGLCKQRSFSPSPKLFTQLAPLKSNFVINSFEINAIEGMFFSENKKKGQISLDHRENSFVCCLLSLFCFLSLCLSHTQARLGAERTRTKHCRGSKHFWIKPDVTTDDHFSATNANRKVLNSEIIYFFFKATV